MGVSKKVKAKPSSKLPAPKTDADKIRALEEQLAQREAEIARLSNENQFLTKEKDQRATELQIINNIGQTLSEGLDLSTTLERVGDRLREALKIESIGIIANDIRTGLVISAFVYLKGKQVIPDRYSLSKNMLFMRFVERMGGKPVVINTNVEKNWRKFLADSPEWAEIPKAFVMVPLLAGGELVGSITIPDYEREDAFTDLPINMLETIASNMGTAIQNVRLFDETQRLLKETEQRATELQIINNIGQTLTEGLDLNTTLERVGDRLREALNIKSMGIVVYDPKPGLAISNYFYHYGGRFTPQRFSMSNYKFSMRLASRVGNKPLVVNANAERYWKKFLKDILPEWKEIPKSFVIVPLLAGGELVGSITIGDYENENAFTNLPINLLETIASNMGTAIQNVRLFDETQRLLKETEQRATELTMLSIVQQSLSSNLDFKAIYEAVGRKLIDIFKVQSASIYTIDLDTKIITYEYAFEPNSDREIGQRPATQFHNHVINQIIASRKSYVINNGFDEFIKQFSDSGSTRRINPKSLCVTPILFQNNMLMAVSLHNIETENFFTDSSVRLLETISNATGVALENARLFDETQRLLKETEQRATELAIINSLQAGLVVQMDLQAIYNLVGEKIRNLFDAQTVDIAIYDRVENLLHFRYTIERGEYFPIEPRPLMGFRKHVIEKRQHLLINDLTREERAEYGQPAPIAGEAARSVLFVPMVVGEEVKGVISLQNLDRTNAFSDADVRLLQTFANSMTVALENARLFDETQRLLKVTEQRATELQIINNIGQTLTEDLDLNSTLERVGERLRSALKVGNIAIAVTDGDTGAVQYISGNRKSFTPDHFSFNKFKLGVRLSMRGLGRSWVVNTNVEKSWRKFAPSTEVDEIPKAFILLPLLVGGEAIGGITIADYEKEDAFSDLSVNLLETIASNMGTAVQNVRLFDETKRLFEEAEKSRAAAEQANKAKSTFLANMSHELRTPLNAIIGFTSIVRRKTEGVLPEKQTDNLDKVLSSSQHLLGLINTALDIAKIEAGRMDVIPTKFHLSALADQCATLAAPLFKSNVTMEKQLDENIGLIFSDQDKIKQIVLNLLSNAAKFTHEGNILLSVQKVNEESVNISVTDSGIGISKEALGRVFEEFQQADNTTTRQYGGTGLGLTISRNLACLLGGDLTATSELGKGSTFTLSLPIQYGRKSASSSDVKPDSVQSTESQADNVTPIEENSDRASLKTILVVEDTELNINLLTQLLEGAYNLLVAKDGAQGVSMAQQENPDLILMDISLPIMDGYEATRRIRMTMPSTPIIGLSAHAMSGDEEKAKEAGCNDYLTKPVNEDLLIQKLNQYLR